MYVSRQNTCMTANLNGPWAKPKPVEQDGKVVGLQSLPRHEHLVLGLKRFNASLMGVQEHHLQSPARHIQRDVVPEKPQKLFRNRWEVLANPSFSKRSGVALAWRKDVWSIISSFTPWRG